MSSIRHDLNDITRSQRGLVTRAELAALGVTPGMRAGLRRSGVLVSAGSRTFELGGVPPDDKRRLLLACLDTGGVISHRSAAWLHALPGFEVGRPPDVLVTRIGSRDSKATARVHSTTWLPPDDIAKVDGIPCTSIARTLFALAALVPLLERDAVKAAVDDAIRRKVASDAWLWWRLEKLRCRGRGGVSVLEEILTARAEGEVTESWLEREFLRVLDDAQVRRPRCQRRVRSRGAFVARVDFLYEELGIVIEVTGAVGHSTPQQRAADAKRRNRLGRLGYLVLEFTYEQVVGDPVAVVAEVVAAMAERAARRG
jgi:very-short-patch-repair endonuclease